MNDLKAGQGSWQLADSDTLLYISAMTNTNTTTKNITKTKDQDCDQDLQYITTITTMTNILANSCNTVTSIGKRPLHFFLLKLGTENSEIFELLYFYIFAAACFKTRQICYRALWLKWERRSEPFFQTFYRMVVVLLIIIIIR